MSDVLSGAKIKSVEPSVYRIPTDSPEADGTFEWDATTMVVVFISAGNRQGLGYTYADASAASLVRDQLRPILEGHDCFDIPALWAAMQRKVRNLGRSGVAACAISAIDSALWDLKAKLLDMPLVLLLGRSRERVAVYGSGGFTCYSDDQLREQLAGWVKRDGCRFVKMKIGAEPDRDPRRALVAKSAIGSAQLFVDANGAFSVKQALRFAGKCADLDIGWFEEPVSSDDRRGLKLMRERAPAAMEIAAGEYVFAIDDARALLEDEAVDVLQADVTRCGGVSGFLQIAALCEAHHIDLSAHCAPALHCHVACSAPRIRHIEWFHDHARIERMLFDGAPAVESGAISLDLTRPGHGLEFKFQDAKRFERQGASA